MTRPWLVRLLAVLMLAGLAWFVVAHTEWVDDDVERPARGAAADDPNYAMARLVRAFGARFEHRRNLEALPPPGATLLLESGRWDVFPERGDQLRRWVEAGGHVVVLSRDLEGEALRAWAPLGTTDAMRRGRCRVRAPAPAASAGGDGSAADDHERCGPSAPTPASAVRPVRRAPSGESDALPKRCVTFTEPEGMPPALPGRFAYRLCDFPGMLGIVATRGATPSWALQADGRAIAMRVDVGRGSVTATSWLDDGNEGLARGDAAAFLAALLQLHPGQVVWDVDDESQPVLALWLWEHARPALLFAALALAAWLWRRAVRFGPRIAAPEAARRSVGDQVAGVAAFLRRHEPAALHHAARRALASLARRHLEGFDTADEATRAAGIALAAGLDARSLQAALRPGPLSTPAQWLAATAALEHARRALLDAVRPRARGGP